MDNNNLLYLTIPEMRFKLIRIDNQINSVRTTVATVLHKLVHVVSLDELVHEQSYLERCVRRDASNNAGRTGAGLISVVNTSRVVRPSETDIFFMTRQDVP
jgi:hypothetical protein